MGYFILSHPVQRYKYYTITYIVLQARFLTFRLQRTARCHQCSMVCVCVCLLVISKSCAETVNQCRCCLGCGLRRAPKPCSRWRHRLGIVELCAKILQIMRNDFKGYARTFCQLCAPFSIQISINQERK